MKPCFTFILWFTISAGSIFPQQQVPANASIQKPNIILIIADDAGYADFGFHGSTEFLTPQLDQLAQNGIIFRQGYVTAAVCGPSRAGLLTGKYQQRFGFEENNVPGIMSPAGLQGDDMGLPLDQETMGDHLKDLGYKTAYFGKWHQGNDDQFHPTKRGFDEFYGFRGGARSYFAFGEGNPNHRHEDWLEQGYKNFQESPKYLTEALAVKAASYIEKNQQESFFLVLAFNAVHTPMDALDSDLAQFPNLTGKRQKLAAMTLAMDRACGVVFDQLSELHLDKNTLLVFINDNGGPSDANESNNLPLSGTKANHLEGGIRIPFIMSWPGQLEANTRFNQPVSTLDLLPTFIHAAGGNVGEIEGLDGVDLLPYLQGQKNGQPHQTLYWKKENRAAIRDGDWKLLRFPDRPAELYDISNDIGEMNNLAATHPELVRKLFQKLFQWELTLERPLWQLERKYEGLAAERMDKYRAH